MRVMREDGICRSVITEPRVYVACLTSYNCGISSGAWRTADQLEEGLRHPHPSPAREEWAIHDTDSVPFIGENPDIPHLIEIMRGIEEWGDAFRAWVELDPHNLQHHDDLGEAFEEAFYGSTMQTAPRRSFCEQIAEDRGWLSDGSPLWGCVDWDAVWNSTLRFEFDFVERRWPEPSYIFRRDC